MTKAKQRKLPNSGKSTVASHGGWEPAERLIYSYFDGTRTLRADPVELLRKIQEASGPTLEQDCKLVEIQFSEGSHSAMLLKASDEAFARLVAAVRTAFGVGPLTEDGGLTQGECLDLFLHFTAFMADLKKKAAPWRSSAEPTAAASSAATSSMPSTPVSSSMSGTSNQGEPILSLADLPEPSPEMRPEWWGKRNQPAEAAVSSA